MCSDINVCMWHGSNERQHCFDLEHREEPDAVMAASLTEVIAVLVSDVTELLNYSRALLSPQSMRLP